jgi:hypothetical protein
MGVEYVRTRTPTIVHASASYVRPVGRDTSAADGHGPTTTTCSPGSNPNPCRYPVPPVRDGSTSAPAPGGMDGSTSTYPSRSTSTHACLATDQLTTPSVRPHSRRLVPSYPHRTATRGGWRWRGASRLPARVDTPPYVRARTALSPPVCCSAPS